MARKAKPSPAKKPATPPLLQAAEELLDALKVVHQGTARVIHVTGFVESRLQQMRRAIDDAQ